MVRLLKNHKNEYYIKLKYPKYHGELIFSSKKGSIAIITKHLKLNGFNFYGFSGFINIPTQFNELNKSYSDRNNIEILLKNSYFIEILSLIKHSLPRNLIQIARRSQKLLNQYRQIFINITADDSIGLKREQAALAQELPVYLVGIGWKRIGELNCKRVYIDLKSKYDVNSKSARAASMGFYIVIVSSNVERELVKKSLNTKNLNQLSDSILEGISIKEHLDEDEKALLKTAGEVMKIMVPKNFPQDLNANENNNLNQYYFAKSPSIDLKNTACEYIKCESQLTNEKYQKAQSKYNNTNASDYIEINNIKLAICELDREDINALTNPVKFEIFINLRSPIIQKIISKEPDVQKVILIEELSHEIAHILGFGLVKHDLEFFKKQRILKYKAFLNI